MIPGFQDGVAPQTATEYLQDKDMTPCIYRKDNVLDLPQAAGRNCTRLARCAVPRTVAPGCPWDPKTAWRTMARGGGLRGRRAERAAARG